MRGSSKAQAGYILSLVNKMGHSKHQDRRAVREILKNEGLSATSEKIAERMGVYDNQTNENYHDKLTELANDCRSEFGCKNMAAITPEMIAKFLEEKIEEQISYSHFSGYCAALTKMELALGIHAEKTGIEVNSFKNVIKELRDLARQELPRFDGRNRAYGSAGSRSIIDNLTRDDCKLVANIQLHAGLRINEASHITPDQLRGNGHLNYIGKGGQHLVASLPQATYQAVLHYVNSHGSLDVRAHTYYSDLRYACTSAKVAYEGSHGFRWEYAQERYTELIGNGISHIEALAKVAEEMGHHRIETTRHYLNMK